MSSVAVNTRVFCMTWAKGSSVGVNKMVLCRSYQTGTL